MNKLNKNISFVSIGFYVFLMTFLFVISSPTVLAADANSSTTAKVTTYNYGSQTILPNFEKGGNDNGKDIMYKEYIDNKDKYPVAEKTTITTCTWDEWIWDNKTNDFIKITTTTKPSATYNASGDASNYVASVLYRPMNENGLKDKITEDNQDIGWKTRSGYGFEMDSYFNIQNPTNDLEYTKTDGTTISNLRASLLFPEFNFSSAMYKFNDTIVNKIKSTTNNDDNIYTYSLNLRDNLLQKVNSDGTADFKLNADGTKMTDGKNQHFTPMWVSDGNYRPALKIGGLWSPIGEISYVIRQDASNDVIKVNQYTIKGSLFDDMYTTHDKYTEHDT